MCCSLEPRGVFSAAVHSEYQKAKKHSDSHQGDGRRGCEELPVVDAEVPDHSQDHHEYGHHQAAGADGHAGRPESSRRHGAGPRPRLGPFLRVRSLHGLGDVAVYHTVVCDV